MTFDQLDNPIVMFGVIQIISLAGTVWAVKTDAKVLGVRVDGLQIEIAKLNNVLIDLVQQTGRINLVEERQLAQGKRLDETTSRINNFIDERR